LECILIKPLTRGIGSGGFLVLGTSELHITDNPNWTERLKHRKAAKSALKLCTLFF
jgi:hypothetical protein